jgi:predicted small secreted protein
MDRKRGGMMIKKGAIFFILSVFLILVSGCETVKGAAGGASEGAKQDWDNAKKLDKKMQEVLW